MVWDKPIKREVVKSVLKTPLLILGAIAVICAVVDFMYMYMLGR